MERIIESHNVTELRELMATFINKNGNVIDFAKAANGGRDINTNE